MQALLHRKRSRPVLHSDRIAPRGAGHGIEEVGGSVMKSMAIIIVRELVARRIIFFAAVFAAIIPLGVPLFQADSSAGAVRNLLTLIVSLGLGWVISLFLGAGMFGSELSEDRMSFLFSRPISAASIWFGKLAATWAIVIGTEAIIILPSVVLFRSEPFSVINDIVLLRWNYSRGISAEGLIVLLTVVVPLFLVLTSHVIGTFWRVPSRFFLFDSVAGGSLVAFLLNWSVRWVPWYTAAVVDFGILMSFSMIIAMFLSGWAQIAAGRSDTGKGRRLLSIVLWATLWFFSLAIISLINLMFAACQ